MKKYKPYISANLNRKGVLDIDSVKGCSLGMSKYPVGGCYGLCYAAKIAKIYNYDFTKSVSRLLKNTNTRQLKLFDNLVLGGSAEVFNMVKRHKLKWFRIGTMGDPCHDWELTINLCEWLKRLRKPVIITKHWIKIPKSLLERFKSAGVIFNTSISPLDTKLEREHRLTELNRLKKAGITSFLRIVSCRFGDTKNGNHLNNIQKELFNNSTIIDNPLRIPHTDKRVVCGDIIVKKYKDLKRESYISINNENTYIGHCGNCPDQCGVL